jgi:zinc transporter ZupT
MNIATVGKWAFIIGLVIAVVAGIFFQAEWVVWVLAILGLIVGLLNVTAEETQSFLLAAVALALSATALNTIPLIGEFFKNILGYVAAFVAGAMIVVALKTLFVTARK